MANNKILIYELWPTSSQDLNKKISILDYLSDLGVTHVWLSDAEAFDPLDIGRAIDLNKRFGEPNEFKAFIKEAHEHNIKVLINMDLCVNLEANGEGTILVFSDQNCKLRNVATVYLVGFDIDGFILKTEEKFEVLSANRVKEIFLGKPFGKKEEPPFLAILDNEQRKTYIQNIYEDAVVVPATLALVSEKRGGILKDAEAKKKAECLLMDCGNVVMMWQGQEFNYDYCPKEDILNWDKVLKTQTEDKDSLLNWYKFYINSWNRY